MQPSETSFCKFAMNIWGLSAISFFDFRFVVKSFHVDSMSVKRCVIRETAGHVPGPEGGRAPVRKLCLICRVLKMCLRVRTLAENFSAVNCILVLRGVMLDHVER